MRKIVAIGGGELAQKETFPIDQEIVRLTEKKNPNALFIPTASSDSPQACDGFDQIYGKELGCKTDHLFLIKEEPTLQEIAAKVEWADLVYAGGGNTLSMMRKWRFTGLNKVLAKAQGQGKILSGLSAGALCWFDYGHSDSLAFYNEGDQGAEWDYIRVKCLGFVDKIMLCPHFGSENRLDHVIDMIKKKGGIGIGLDDHCAIEIIDNTYRIIATREDANAYRVFKQGKHLRHVILPKEEAFRPIFELLRKA